MESGLKVLRRAARLASGREARAKLILDFDFDSDGISDSDSRFPPSRRKRSRSYREEDHSFNDSAVGGINSNTSSGVTGFTYHGARNHPLGHCTYGGPSFQDRF